MTSQPNMTKPDKLPDEIRELCDQIHAAAAGLPVIIFLPTADKQRLYPLVIVAEDQKQEATQLNAWLNGEEFTPPKPTAIELWNTQLDAIHAAAGLLPTVAFIADTEQTLHPLNLIPDSIPTEMQPFYQALEQREEPIKNGPVMVNTEAAEPSEK